MEDGYLSFRIEFDDGSEEIWGWVSEDLAAYPSALAAAEAKEKHDADYYRRPERRIVKATRVFSY